MSYRKTCKRCGKPKSVPAKPQKGVSAKEFLADPYCSRACCEADLGLSGAQDKKPGIAAAAAA